MFGELSIEELEKNGIDYKSIHYDIIEEDMDWANQDDSFLSFKVKDGEDLYIQYSINIRPTFIWSKVKHPAIMFAEKRVFNARSNRSLSYERIFRSGDSSILDRHIKSIFNHIIKYNGKDFRNKELIEIFIRDFNIFLKEGFKKEDDPNYKRDDRSPFTFSHKFEMESFEEKVL